MFKEYTFNKINYYLTDDLIKEYPKMFKGCKNTRALIAKQKIPNAKYIFARFTNKNGSKPMVKVISLTNYLFQ